jgi:hypothetical protein
MSRDQQAGQHYNMKINDKHFEWLKDFKYLGKPPINQKCVHKEINSRLQSSQQLTADCSPVSN